MKKELFWYPLANIKNWFLFGGYGPDVYIVPEVIVNRPRVLSLGDGVKVNRNTNINLHPRDRHSKEILFKVGKWGDHLRELSH